MANKLAGNKISASTQKYLDISEIKEDTVIMKDGSLRSILMVSSVNFALKSEDEQNGLVGGYVSFLNNLDFSLQIVVQSRDLNINVYLDRIKKKQKEQTNELLRMQMEEYVQYVKELVSLGKIMSKKFFIIIPYSPSSSQKRGFFSSMFDILKPAVFIRLKEERFQKHRRELNRRIERVVGGLSSMGLNSVQLDTQSAIELFYNTYNPVTSKNQTMTDVNNLRVAE